MKRLLLICCVLAALDVAARTPVLVGMTDTARYFPLLAGRRVAVLANHTSVAELPGVVDRAGRPVATDAAGRVHLVDLLHARGFDVGAIFSPEHGFRGTADAGEHVSSSVDARTGIPIRSLYDGNTRRPPDEAMRSFDVLVVDMQDVGLRFYTYYIAMLRMMEACADYGHEVIVLDRPFECYGHPALRGAAWTARFTPRPTAGAKHPPLEGEECRGEDLSTMPLEEARGVGLSLGWLIAACRNLGMGERFFTPMFEKLIGVGYVREMILAGASEEEIRARWTDDLVRYRTLRARYLLYE